MTNSSETKRCHATMSTYRALLKPPWWRRVATVVLRPFVATWSVLREPGVLIVVLGVIFAIAILASCAPAVTTGTIVEKSYDDPDHWTTQQPIYRQDCRPVTRTRTTYVNGKSSTSTYTTTECTQRFSHYQPVAHYDGPHWRLKLRDREDPERTGWVEVDQTTFDRATVGRWYPLEQGGAA